MKGDEVRVRGWGSGRGLCPNVGLHPSPSMGGKEGNAGRGGVRDRGHTTPERFSPHGGLCPSNGENGVAMGQRWTKGRGAREGEIR